MGTTIRPNISEKNEYWIEKHRYYELKHFCRQYPIWKKAYSSLVDSNISSSVFSNTKIKNNEHSDPTAKCAEAKMFFYERIKMIEKTAVVTNEILSSYLLEGVTKGKSYEYLKMKMNIPCCKDTYYKLYRRFFFLLNSVRN
ncbi:MAG: hypothetical protein GX660_25555 [Clostridiaceae bacterium]|nr:hypothetical protein [Clostridiaceae bacterium]